MKEQKQKKSRYWLIVLVVCLFLLTAAAYAGFTLSNADKEEDLVVSAGNDTLTENNCVMSLTAQYVSCSHRSETDIPLRQGKTLSQLKEEYPAYTFTDFSAKNVVAYVRITAYCPEHYLLKLEGDGMLYVYQTEENTGKLLNTQKYYGANIPTDHADVLKTGKLFAGMDELIAYIKQVNATGTASSTNFTEPGRLPR